MAYTFDRINDLIEKNNSSSNIFGGDAQGGGQQSGQQQGQPPSQPIGGGGESVGTSQQPTQNQGRGPVSAQPKQSSAQAIVSKAKQSNLDTSGFTKGIQQGISGAQSQLENEANSYVTQQQTRAKGGLDSNTINAAQYGDDKGNQSFSQVEGLLRGPATQADDFRFGGATSFNDLDNISTQGGLQNYLQKRGNENYNQGQAALDSLLISKDKNYQTNLSQAKKDRDALRERQIALEGGSKRSEAQAAIDQKEAAARQAALEQLSGLRGGIDSTLSQQSSAYNTNLANLRANAPQKAKAEADARFSQMIAQNPELAQFLTEVRASIDPSKFYSVAADTSADQFATGDDASRYNRILQLIGQGGATKTAGGPLGAADSFNASEYQKNLMNAAIAARERYEASKTPSQGTLYGGGGGGLPGQNALEGMLNQGAGGLNQITGGQSNKAVNQAKSAAGKLKKRL